MGHRQLCATRCADALQHVGEYPQHPERNGDGCTPFEDIFGVAALYTVQLENAGQGSCCSKAVQARRCKLVDRLVNSGPSLAGCSDDGLAVKVLGTNWRLAQRGIKQAK